eukprot:3192031-Rhodomonas_salina.3
MSGTHPGHVGYDGTRRRGDVPARARGGPEAHTVTDPVTLPRAITQQSSLDKMVTGCAGKEFARGYMGGPKKTVQVHCGKRGFDSGTGPESIAVEAIANASLIRKRVTDTGYVHLTEKADAHSTAKGVRVPTCIALNRDAACAYGYSTETRRMRRQAWY